MKLNMKVLFALFVLCIVALGSILYSSVTLQQVDSRFQGFVNEEVIFLSKTKDVYTLGLQRGQALRNLILNPTDSTAKNNFDKAVDDSLQVFDVLEPLAKQFGFEQEVDAIKKLTLKDIELQNNAIELIKISPEEAFNYVINQETPTWREVKSNYFTLEDNIMKVFNTGTSELHDSIVTKVTILYVVIGLFIAFSIFIYLFINKIVTKPIISISKQVQQIATGDLTVKKISTKSKDEVGDLINAVNIMVENIKGLVEQTAVASNRIQQSSEEVRVASGEVKEGIEQVAATTEELASGSTTQAEHANQSMEMVHDVAQDVELISQYANQLSDSSKKTDDASRDGVNHVQQSIEQMNLIEGKVASTLEIIQGFVGKSKEINHILEVINDIAAQTNLLALNAAIEAARAGEHGRGFAVVADEVRKLAEESAKSTQQIGSIILSVQQEAEQSGKAMDEVVQEVRLGLEVIDNNGKSFTEIASIIDEMNQKIISVVEVAKQINHSIEKTVSAVENIASITEETSAGAEELSATMEEQNASMQEINSMSDHLAKQAKELNNAISKFKYM